MFVRKSLIFFPLIFLLLALAGCAHGERSYIPELDGGNTAPGAAFTADSMNFRKAMPLRQDWKPMEFYYKHCSDIGDEVYYSKTSYECTDPF